MAKSVLIYGESGSFKSTQMIFLAKYVYKKTGKKTRIVLTDSSAGDMFNPLQAAGIVDVWRISALADPLPVARLLAKGWWPVATGDTSVKMAPSTEATWKEVGGLTFDSISTFCDLIMADLMGKNRKVSEDVATPFSEKVATAAGGMEEIKFAASARAHYGFIQNQVYTLINSASSLPIEIVGLTALESKGEEQDRTTVYGPAIIGKAATPKAPAWVGDCLHFETALVPRVTMMDVKGPDGKMAKVEEKVFDTVVRAYFMRHPDPKTGIHFPAKPRVPPEMWPELLKAFPGGYFEPGLEAGLDHFLEVEDSLLLSSGDRLKKWREEMDSKRMGGAGQVTAAGQAKVGQD